MALAGNLPTYVPETSATARKLNVRVGASSLAPGTATTAVESWG